ncbi:MAG: cytochrome c [Actinomycetota bacterium]|nr:cytochrome c [Actinomycetota bacterium]
MPSGEPGSKHLIRLVVLPGCLFLTFAGGAFALAKLHPAKPGTPKAGPVQLGDSYRGEVVFTKNCAACHGQAGEGGSGPKLAGSSVTLTRAKAQIESGGSTMPPKLVSGQDERDVLAYLATIVKQ